MKLATLAKTLALVTASTLVAGAASARDQIRIVGSSTVYPFTTTVAEQVGKAARIKTPVVESTGTGGGMKLFCAGVGENHPDATNASRRMKKSEFEDCQKNGVKDIVELNIGFDGLTVAQSKQGSPDQALAGPASACGCEGSARSRRQAGRRTRTRTGPTSTSPCRTSRSRSWARPRPRAPAIRSMSCCWRRVQSRFRRSSRSRRATPKHSTGCGRRCARMALTSRLARTTT